MQIQQQQKVSKSNHNKTSPKTERILPKQLIYQEKSLNVKPINNFKFQNQGYQRHKSLQQQPKKEETKTRNNIKYQQKQVLDKILPLIKQDKINK